MRALALGSVLAAGLLAFAAAASCGVDVEGAASRDPAADGGPGPGPAPDAGLRPSDGGAPGDAERSDDASPDAEPDATADAGDGGCTGARCNGACVPTCTGCAAGGTECRGVCVPSCAACDDKFACVGCTELGVARPVCAKNRDFCPVGDAACACVTVATCPSNEHVCAPSGGTSRCLTCNMATKDLSLQCKSGNGCDGDCD